MKYKQGLNKKEYEDLTIEKMDISQLQNTSNDVNMREESADRLPSEFTHGLDKVADGDRLYSDSEPVVFNEMDRFCKQHEFDSETLIQGNKTSDYPKNLAINDDVAKSKKGKTPSAQEKEDEETILMDDLDRY